MPLEPHFTHFLKHQSAALHYTDVMLKRTNTTASCGRPLRTQKKKKNSEKSEKAPKNVKNENFGKQKKILSSHSHKEHMKILGCWVENCDL